MYSHNEALLTVGLSISYEDESCCVVPHCDQLMFTLFVFLLIMKQLTQIITFKTACNMLGVKRNTNSSEITVHPIIPSAAMVSNCCIIVNNVDQL